MADEDVVDEAFRTAAGMARAVLREDIDGVRALWSGSEEPERVGMWLATVAAVAASSAAHLRGMTPEQWFDEQLKLFRRSAGGGQGF